MSAGADGWFELTTSEARVGTLYQFALADGMRVPDPASRYQPEDVSGPSEVIDPDAYGWGDQSWRGRPWADAILYELHVGTFTQEGTFSSAISRLEHLAALGVTGIELMCIADFAGTRNWGYDGVLLFAPDSAYGRPEEVKAFIDAAHARGLMVILDVVYNHFGPEGNYLPKYFPKVLTDRHCTPWGSALNFDGEGSLEVREFIIHNAIYWMEEFHVDGLRLDAAHAMIDESQRHILDELADRVRAVAGDRFVHLILENEQNVGKRLLRDKDGKATCYTAQWNHDMTHLLGASMAQGTGEDDDDGGETEKLGKALAEGYVIAAQMNENADAPCLPVSPTSFIAFLQTHDLIGNRIFGDRIYAVAPLVAVRAVSAVLLLLPQVPMIFMGDEFGASTPFPYFCDFHGDLAEAVRKGRCEQLANQDPKPSPEELERAPNPQCSETFRSGKLRWSEAGEGVHAEWLAWYRQLLAIRAAEIVPLLRGISDSCGTYRVIGRSALILAWTLGGGTELQLGANLRDEPTSGFDDYGGRVLWEQGSTPGEGVLGAWSVRWRLKRPNDEAGPI